MEVLILGICHEIFFFGKKRSKIRVRIIHRHALYTGKYGNTNSELDSDNCLLNAKLLFIDLTNVNGKK